jgi:hypothetical protein
MQLHPDLNTDASPVFDWFAQQEITDTNGNIFKVFIRIVGENELGQAKVFALRKVNELRLKLNDPSSDERLGLLLPKELIDAEQLRATILYFKLQELVREAGKEIKIKYPKEPSDESDIEAHAKYQEELDTWQDKLNAKIQEYTNAKYEKVLADYKNKTTDDLYPEYVKLITLQLCEQEFQNNLRDMCTYFGTYKDEELKERFFSSFTEFENLHSKVKQQFLDFYHDLDLSTDELKK